MDFHVFFLHIFPHPCWFIAWSPCLAREHHLAAQIFHHHGAPHRFWKKTIFISDMTFCDVFFWWLILMIHFVHLLTSDLNFKQDQVSISLFICLCLDISRSFKFMSHHINTSDLFTLEAQLSWRPGISRFMWIPGGATRHHLFGPPVEKTMSVGLDFSAFFARSNSIVDILATPWESEGPEGQISLTFWSCSKHLQSISGWWFLFFSLGWKATY